MEEVSLTRGQLQFEYARRYFEEFTASRPHIARALHEVETPALLIDLDGVRERVREIRQDFEGIELYYAVKANDSREVLEVVQEEGAGFEVASTAELEAVLSTGAEPERIISSNPVKPPDFIRRAWEAGVRTFAVDSFEEVVKISELAPRSKVYVRLTVPNEGSDWPLSRKFGVDPQTAMEILVFARERGLVPSGITFHVGSQCNNLRNWFIAIKRSYQLWEMAGSRGIRLTTLNMGGGIPVPYIRPSLRPGDIAYYVKGLLTKYFPASPSEVQIEPGRAVVGDQGILVAKVIGKAKRGEENWLYVDTGVFNGLAEALGGIRYPLFVEREGELKEWVIGGVSCDSMDVIAKSIFLPEPEIGDRIYFLSAGAYTAVYASRFNGFPEPKVIGLRSQT